MWPVFGGFDGSWVNIDEANPVWVVESYKIALIGGWTSIYIHLPAIYMFTMVQCVLTCSHNYGIIWENYGISRISMITHLWLVCMSLDTSTLSLGMMFITNSFEFLRVGLVGFSWISHWTWFLGLCHHGNGWKWQSTWEQAGFWPPVCPRRIEPHHFHMSNFSILALQTVS